MKGRWFDAPEKYVLLKLVASSELSVRKACRVLGLNPSRYYRWRKRCHEQGFEGLHNRKSTPGGCPHRLLPEERELIVDQALEHPDIRHRKLAYRLQNEGICYVSPSTVYRVLRSENLIAKRPAVEQRQADGSVPVSRPNELWHTDITYIPVADGFAYLITVLDGYSRYPVHWELCRSMTAEDMQRVFDRAIMKANLAESDEKPILLSDNGTQMIARSFTVFLEELAIEHRRIAVGHAEANGKIEVFHKTIKYEHIYVQERYENFYEAREDLNEFIRYYAEERLHQALGYVTPKERYEGQAEDIIRKRKRAHERAIEERKHRNQEKALSQVA